MREGARRGSGGAAGGGEGPKPRPGRMVEDRGPWSGTPARCRTKVAVPAAAGRPHRRHWGARGAADGSPESWHPLSIKPARWSWPRTRSTWSCMSTLNVDFEIE